MDTQGVRQQVCGRDREGLPQQRTPRMMLDRKEREVRDHRENLHKGPRAKVRVHC